MADTTVIAELREICRILNISQEGNAKSASAYATDRTELGIEMRNYYKGCAEAYAGSADLVRKLLDRLT